MELKSPDEKLARETISESGIGESGNPIYRDFSTVDAKSEGVVFSGLLCSPIRDAAQRQRKDDGNAKGEHADCGSKAMLRVCNSTNKENRHRRKERNIRASVLQKKEQKAAEWMERRVKKR